MSCISRSVRSDIAQEHEPPRDGWDELEDLQQLGMLEPRHFKLNVWGGVSKIFAVVPEQYALGKEVVAKPLQSELRLRKENARKLEILMADCGVSKG
jgi:hypothetical protein